MKPFLDLVKTAAELFAIEYGAVDGNKSSVVSKLESISIKHDLRTVSPITSGGLHIGARYIFGDASFADFYNEAPTKIFTGINATAFKENH